MAISVGDIVAFLRLRDEMSPALAIASQNLSKAGSQMQQAGMAMLPISAAMAAVGGGAVKAAIDFESSFAGVRKTVDATEPEFRDLSDAFREMAKEIPVSVNEINRIAEAGGQLGVKAKDLKGFTRIMADLGATTNLSSDQAATALAQIANIMANEAGPQYDRLGATIAHLGNKSNATEAQIVEFGLRLAGAGKVVGMTEAEILSFGTALASVGINAEAGGTAFSKVFIEMSAAVSKGGKDLDEFAKVAGMSTAQFSKGFKEDAAGAVIAFVEGLNRIQKEGGDLFGVLEKLDIKEQRMRDSLLRSAGAGQLLADTMREGNKAWQENSALTEEASKRYETTASQLTILWNRVQDTAITLGNGLLPVVKQAISFFNVLIPVLETGSKLFASLPLPIQTIVLALGVMLAAASPVLLVVGSLSTGIGILIPLVTTLAPAIGAVSIAMSVLAVKAIALTAAFSLGYIAGKKLEEMFIANSAAAKMAADAWDKYNQTVGTGGLGQDAWSAKMKESAEAAKANRIAVLGMIPVIQGVDKATVSHAKATDSSLRATLQNAINSKKMEDAGKLLGRAVTSLAEAEKVLAIQQELGGGAAKKHTAELEKQREAFEKLAPFMPAFQRGLEVVSLTTGVAARAWDDFVKSIKPATEILEKSSKAAHATGLAQIELNKVIDYGSGLWTRYADVVKQELDNANDSVKEHVVELTAFERAYVKIQDAIIILQTLDRALDQMGVSAESNLRIAVQGFEELGVAVQDGMEAYTSFASGDIVGGVISSIKAIGGAVSGLKKIWTSLFGNAEIEKVNDMRDAFFESQGGFEALAKRLATVSDQDLVKKIFDARTVDQFNAAVNEAMSLLGLQTEAQELLTAAIEKYGFEMGELGPIWAQQELDKKAAELYQDYRLLSEAGVDHVAIINRMGPAFNEYVQQCIKGGVEIPEALRPMIEDMIANKQILDENGVAFESIEAAGITFGKTMSQMFTDLIKKVDDLINALLGIKPVTVPVNIEVNDPNGILNGGHHPKEQIVAQHGYHGIVSRPTHIIAGEAGPERVDISPLGGGGGRGGGGGGSAPPTVQVFIGSDKIIPSLVRWKNAGYL